MSQTFPHVNLSNIQPLESFLQLHSEDLVLLTDLDPMGLRVVITGFLVGDGITGGLVMGALVGDGVTGGSGRRWGDRGLK